MRLETWGSSLAPRFGLGFCDTFSSSAPFQAPASSSRLINIEVDMIHGKHMTHNPTNPTLIYSKTLLPIHHTLHLTSHSFLFKCLIWLYFFNQPIFLTTLSFKSHSFFFMPLCCIQTLRLLHACCESYPFFPSYLYFQTTLFWTAFLMSQLLVNCVDCVDCDCQLWPRPFVPVSQWIC